MTHVVQVFWHRGQALNTQHILASASKPKQSFVCTLGMFCLLGAVQTGKKTKTTLMVQDDEKTSSKASVLHVYTTNI